MPSYEDRLLLLGMNTLSDTREAVDFSFMSTINQVSCAYLVLVKFCQIRQLKKIVFIMSYSREQDNALGILFSLALSSKTKKYTLTQMLAEYKETEGKHLEVSDFCNEVQFLCESKLFLMEYATDHWVVTPIPPTEETERMRKLVLHRKRRGAGNTRSIQSIAVPALPGDYSGG